MTNQTFFRNFAKETLIKIKNELLSDYTQFCLTFEDEKLEQINQAIGDICTELNRQQYNPTK